ncbi:MAG TPA: hypothetical protein VMF89_21900, partial [Polyangiales bacterium]|nr:hypothetical protein [Polyangiales bacterium]
MHPWSEVWSKVEGSQPERLLQHWLDAMPTTPGLAAATRLAFGEDTQRAAAELKHAMAQAARGEPKLLRERLAQLGSALAQQGAPYAQLHALGAGLRS